MPRSHSPAIAVISQKETARLLWAKPSVATKIHCPKGYGSSNLPLGVYPYSKSPHLCAQKQHKGY